ncbi:MAG: lipid kinase [Candidatus Eremiobacteraeota bacterium]|nr:lipid kinase [Candidatus Eremiobacteraeota bacterium]
MRALVVYNPESRRGAEAIAQLPAMLAAAGIEAVRASKEALRAVTPQADCVIGAGGDGTLSRLIPTALRWNVPLGVVPFGTFNELARTLNVPLDPAQACLLIASAHTRPIDVARVNGIYYFSEASIGVSSRIARLQTPAGKRRFGSLAIVLTTLQSLRYVRPMRVAVSFDGHSEHLKTIQLTVANSGRFGGFFNVAGAAIDDGWLDLYSVEIDTALEAIGVAGAMLRGRRADAPGLRTYRSTRFVVSSRRRHHIRADGEPAGRTPATFEVLPKALRVFAPD